MTLNSFYTFLFCLAFNSCGFSQSLTTKETSALQVSIAYYFDAHLQVNGKILASNDGAPQEVFLCLLNIDSLGKIEAIHWLGENRFKDSAYAILTKMKVSDFKNWQVEKCKGKTIALLINVNDKFKGKELIKLSGLAAFFKARESEDLIIIRGMALSWPTHNIRKTTSTN